MNTLPLLTRATDDGVTFAMTPRALVRTDSPRPIVGTEPATRMPTRALEPGEHYRFHLDMGQGMGRWSGVPQLEFLPLLGLTAWSLLWLHLVVLRLHAATPLLDGEGRLPARYTATSPL
jgi:hypothetical protein